MKSNIGLTIALVLTLSGLPSLSAKSLPAAPERPGSGLYAFSERTPSYWRMTRGNRLYSIGRHYSAIHFYERAAYYADKFGQYNVGAMYLRGEGADFDPVQGWAWIKLSAERGYVQMEQVADELYELLDSDQQRRAVAHYEEDLLPVYGDAVAVPRAQRMMDRERRQSTGSRLGSAAALSMLRVIPGRFSRTESALSYDGQDYYDAAAWDMQAIIAYETWQMDNWARGQVEIGEFDVVEDDQE